MDKKIVIGITGGIGSGKTAVSDILLRLGAYIIDADVVARQVLLSESSAIMAAIPECVQNGAINRQLLREIIFSSESSRQKINQIMHPLIFKKINEQLKSGINIVVVPLLFESGFNKLCDYILSVSASQKVRLRRVAARDGVRQSAVKAVINRQIDPRQLKRLSNHTIKNDGDLPQLSKKVERWYKEVQKLYFG